MHHNLIIKDGDTTKVVKEVLVDGIQFVDETPRKGSTNPVTSDGVNKAIGDTKESVDEDVQDLQQQIDDIAEKAGSGYIPKGEATVATLNSLSGQENGWLYTMTDAGTLTDGTLAVVAGDTVAWDEANSVWYKAMDYAPRQYGTDEVHNLSTTITDFRTGDVIPVDGPSGTAKMSKDDLLKETADNTLGSIHLLSDTASEADLVAGKFLGIDTPSVTKKLEGLNIYPKLSFGCSSSDDVRNAIVEMIVPETWNSENNITFHVRKSKLSDGKYYSDVRIVYGNTWYFPSRSYDTQEESAVSGKEVFSDRGIYLLWDWDALSSSTYDVIVSWSSKCADKRNAPILNAVSIGDGLDAKKIDKIRVTDRDDVNKVLKELLIPSGVSFNVLSGIRMWHAHYDSTNEVYWTGIQLTGGGNFYNFYKTFATQQEAEDFATEMFVVENVRLGTLYALIDWSQFPVGTKIEKGVTYSSDCIDRNKMPQCNTQLTKDECFVAINETDRKTFKTKESLAISAGNISGGAFVPTSANRCSSKTIKCPKGSLLRIYNPWSVLLGFAVKFYDENGCYIKEDGARWSDTSVMVPVKTYFDYPIVQDCIIRVSFRDRYDNSLSAERIAQLNDSVFVYTAEKDFPAAKICPDEIFTDVIPDTYYEAFRQKVQNDVGVPLFVIQTDMHYSISNGYPHALTCIRQLAKMLKIAPMPMVANLGDIVNGYTYKPCQESDIAIATNAYRKMQTTYLQLFGNHDDNSWAATSLWHDNAQIITPDEWCGLVNPMMRAYGCVATKNTRRYGLWDDIVHKVRYIYLDTADIDYTLLNPDETPKYVGQYKQAVRQEQLNFLISALHNASDWKVVILSHHPLYKTGGSDVVNADLVQGILEAFKNKTDYHGVSTITDFEAEVTATFSSGTFTSAGPLVGCFCGHTHSDNIWTLNGINYVSTQCGHVHNNQTEERSTSDETMNAFDYVSITSNTCYLRRFGYGSDRSFVFA